MNRWIIAGVALIVALYVFFSSIFVLTEREQAIVTRFGEIVREEREPGLYFKIPTDFIETVQVIDKRLLRYNLERIRLQVSGGQFYIVDAFLTYRIVDPTRFRQSVLGSIDLAEQRIATRFESALRAVYGLREFDAALSEQRAEMMREARDLVAADMRELGIEVEDVRILVTDLTPEVSAQTYERMQAERLAEAALIRARGEEQAQTIRAIADRQAVEIVSAANRDSEIIRGQGDASATNLFAQAFQQDVPFFEFYRSMEAYRTALGDGNTTMVLSPDSEFFSFFGTGGLPELAPPSGPVELDFGELTEEPTDPADFDELLTTPQLVAPEEPDADGEAAPAGEQPTPDLETLLETENLGAEEDAVTPAPAPEQAVPAPQP